MTEEKKIALKQAGLTDEQIKNMEQQEESTTDKLTKDFVSKLYVPKYKPSVYSSKIKENFSVQIKSFSFESVDTDKSRKNIMSKTGNMPSIPSMEELQKQGQTAYNLIINGALSTESHTEFNEVERFVLNLNSLKSLSNFQSIDNCFNATTGVYEIESISIDNRLKRVTFNPISK
jgi:hypothetical protein